MIRRRRTRRGVSLTEVLVALFIMALGMIALLTLFPLGAMQIGQALKDDRTAQTASQADGFLRTYWRHNIAKQLASKSLANEDFVLALDDPNLLWRAPLQVNGGVFQDKYVGSSGQSYPNPGGLMLPTGYMLPPPPARGSSTAITYPSLDSGMFYSWPPDNTTTPGDDYPPLPVDRRYVQGTSKRASTPSYPVLIDPLGYLARPENTLGRYWVGGDNVLDTFPAGTPVPLLIPRRNVGLNNLRYLAGTQINPVYPAPSKPNPDPRLYSRPLAFQTCALTDDMTFQSNGSPIDPSNPGVIARQGRYSWAALVQRPSNDQPAAANMTIMVFDGRPPFLASPGDELVVNKSWDFTNNAPVTLQLQVGARSVTLLVPTRSPDQAPLIRRGGWILDGTIGQAPLKVQPWTNPQEGKEFLTVRHGNFYRIVGVTEAGTSGAFTIYVLDLETPIQPLANGRTTLNDAANLPTAVPISYSAQVYLFAGLSEVFERQPLQLDPAVQQ